MKRPRFPRLLRPAVRIGPTALSAWLLLSVPARTEVVYREDFESGEGGYAASPLSTWSWGTPTNGPGAAHSGTNAWATGLQSNYRPGANDYLISPPIDLQWFTNHLFLLTWWQCLVTEPGFDFASLEVSRDGGGTWAVAYGEVSGVVNANWTRQRIVLGPEYAVVNFRFRFRLRSDASYDCPGVFLDDIQVRTLLARSDTSQELAVYREDFEAGPGGFTVNGPTSWEWGVPAADPGPDRPGSRLWATSLSGFYGANEDGCLTSPPIDLSAWPGRAFLLSWWQCLVTEANADFASVEVSGDGGDTWRLAEGEVSGAVARQWIKATIPLDVPYAVTNFQVRFRLRSDDALQDHGFYVDDVEVAVVLEELPVARDCPKRGHAGTLVPFRAADFATNFASPDELRGVRFHSLPHPDQARMLLHGLEVVAGQEIPFAELENLVCAVPPDAVGPLEFDWNGADALFYAASNARVRMVLTALPVAESDSFLGLQNTSVCFAASALLANDSSSDGSALRVESIDPTSEAGGEVLRVEGTVFYTPPRFFAGPDRFHYQVSDEEGGAVTGTVVMQVSLPLAEPVTPVELIPELGLFGQSVRVTNPLTNSLCGTIYHGRLLVTGLSTNDTVANASGTSEDTPFIAFDQTLAPGESTDLLVLFGLAGSPTNLLDLAYAAHVLDASASTNGTGAPLEISRFRGVPGSGFDLEFVATPGQVYQIERSVDLMVWQSWSAALLARNARVQWIDDSPQAQASANGEIGTGYYRVRLLSPAGLAP